MGRFVRLAEKALLLVVVIVPLVATAYAVYRLWNLWVTPVDLALLVSLYALTVIGIGMGFHRMLTHRSFTAPAPVRFVLLVLGSMALQGPAIQWASTHIKHHAKSDKDGDPHSPLQGFFHAHLGWLFMYGWGDVDAYGKHLKEDKVVMFVSRTFGVWAVLGFVIPFAIGGWTGLLWGGAVRVFLSHHVTWSVNSVCHTFGRRPFDTVDESRNQWTVGLLALGEGWHNNHHAFPKSAYHGLRWWQFDVQGYIIRVMAKLRLVRDVWAPKKEEIAARMNAAKRAVGERTQEFKLSAQAKANDLRSSAQARAQVLAASAQAKAKEAGEQAGRAVRAVQKAAGDAVAPPEGAVRRKDARRLNE